VAPSVATEGTGIFEGLVSGRFPMTNCSIRQIADVSAGLAFKQRQDSASEVISYPTSTGSCRNQRYRLAASCTTCPLRQLVLRFLRFMSVLMTDDAAFRLPLLCAAWFLFPVFHFRSSISFSSMISPSVSVRVIHTYPFTNNSPVVLCNSDCSSAILVEYSCFCDFPCRKNPNRRQIGPAHTMEA
jgi:hypothetical protein